MRAPAKPATAVAMPQSLLRMLYGLSADAGIIGPSQNAAVGGPSGQLVSVRELELAKHGRDVRLDRLDRDPEVVGNLLVGVAARDVAQDLALTRREQVELWIRCLRHVAGERVEDEAGKARREHRI